jgi:uncharacterized membrane protein YsdA (DUF1294 family)
MLFCTKKDYPTITLQALAGFSEDKTAARRYTRRFLHLSLSCVAALLSFGAFICIPIFRGQGDSVPQIYVVLAGVSLLVAIVLFVITWRRMVGGVPISPRSGRPMEVYRLEDTVKEGRYELVYLCRQSQTFFRMVFGAPGD